MSFCSFSILLLAHALATKQKRRDDFKMLPSPLFSASHFPAKHSIDASPMAMKATKLESDPLPDQIVWHAFFVK